METPIAAEHGKLRIGHLHRILEDIGAQTDVVGMSFTKYMPWDALALKKLLSCLNRMLQ